MTAIAACEATAKAQKQYFSQVRDGGTARQYAQKLVSDPGRQNVVYWPVTEGQTPSQLGDFAKVVSSSTGDHPALFNGYYYRFLTKPSGFDILAYPAEYRNTGS